MKKTGFVLSLTMFTGVLSVLAAAPVYAQTYSCDRPSCGGAYAVDAETGAPVPAYAGGPFAGGAIAVPGPHYEETTLSGSVATGTAGSGGAAGIQKMKFNTNADFAGSDVGMGQLEFGLVQKNSKLRPIGTAGFAMPVQHGAGFGDPALFHSDGTYTQVGGDPALLLGAGFASTNLFFYINPRMMYLNDSVRDVSLIGGGASVYVAAKASDNVQATVLLQAAKLGEQNSSGKGVFYMAKATGSYKISPDVALGASAEVSDLSYTKDAQTPATHNPSVLATFGVMGAF